MHLRAVSAQPRSLQLVAEARTSPVHGAELNASAGMLRRRAAVCAPMQQAPKQNSVRIK